VWSVDYDIFLDGTVRLNTASYTRSVYNWRNLAKQTETVVYEIMDKQAGILVPGYRTSPEGGVRSDPAPFAGFAGFTDQGFDGSDLYRRHSIDRVNMSRFDASGNARDVESEHERYDADGTASHLYETRSARKEFDIHSRMTFERLDSFDASGQARGRTTTENLVFDPFSDLALRTLSETYQAQQGAYVFVRGTLFEKEFDNRERVTRQVSTDYLYENGLKKYYRGQEEWNGYHANTGELENQTSFEFRLDLPAGAVTDEPGPEVADRINLDAVEKFMERDFDGNAIRVTTL
jgi:hypothetical protein